MNNFLGNGAVLPSGLLGENAESVFEGFKKTYQNNALKVGIVIQTYGVDSSDNLNGLIPEYDVMVFEQNEDQGSTVINYRHCIASNSLGSVADFMEFTIRKLKNQTSKGSTPSPAGQNGSIVLLLCLNGMSDTGVIIGALGHPDRPTTLPTSDPRLEGEYNGVNIKVETDGSTSLTFRGATDNDGKVIDSTQGDTVMSIEKDGSFQIKHANITQRLDKQGVASTTASDNIESTTQKDFVVTATGNVNLTATKDMNTSSNNLAMNAQGSATLMCQKLSVTAQSDITLSGSDLKVEAEAMANIKAPTIVLDGMVSLGGQGGQPILLLGTQFLGVGNLGAPVLSTAIAGFATKVTAT